MAARADAKAPTPAIQAVVGLGNPGAKYAATRHNIGARVVDELARRHALSWQSKFKGRWCRLMRHTGNDVVLLAPETFMNLSGQSVQPMCTFFRIAPPAVLVVHDELELPFGQLKLKVGGGHGGHNGLRSIGQQLGDRSFVRLRVGIGRPQKGDVASWVLAPFGAEERGWVDQLVDAAADAVERTLNDGVRAAMDPVNQTRVG